MMTPVRAPRASWRAMLGRVQDLARLAVEANAVLSGPDAHGVAMAMRADLRGVGMARFPVDGASAEGGRMALVILARAVLDAGLPRTRARLALALGVLAEELDGMIVDQVVEGIDRFSPDGAGSGD